MFAYVLIFLELYYVLTVADKPQRRYEFNIKALESQRSRHVCFIDDLDKQIDGWDDLSCNNYGKENFVPEGTYCHVYQEDLIFEYHCLEGTWRPSTGTDVHIRSKRWLDWLLVPVVIVAIVIGIIVYNHPNSNTNTQQNTNSYPLVQKSPQVFSKPCRPDNLLQTYIADSKQTKVNVTWSDPVATDDGKVVKNEQTGGIMKGNEFPGSSSPGSLHEVTYTATDDKGLKDTCTFNFTVIYLTCNEPSIPAHGRKVSCPNNYIYGGQCTFECDIGYEMIGENTVTCQKNQTWENIPSCRKKLCPRPFNISNGYVLCEDTTHPYDEDCDFLCNEGFRLNGSRKMTCQVDQTWSVNATDVSCEDDKPPIIECQSHQVFYADRGAFHTSVSWIIPSASDNVDSNPVIEKLSGPSLGDVLTEGYHSVVYKSTDIAGNSHATLSKCTIILEVKVIKCATGPTDALADSKFMNYTCSDTFFYNGVSCNLGCLLNLPLNGTDLVNCERDGITGKGIWNWGPGPQPFCQVGTCPDLDAPANGGFTTDTILGRPLHVMFCRKGYDIASINSRNGIPFAGWLSCHDNGQWFPLDTFPDCVVSNLPWLTVPAELYYAGDCNNESTTSMIKRQALSYLSNIQTDINNSICPNPNTCKVENLAVMCGNITARKRRETAPHWLTKRQTGYALVTWEIKVLFDRGNRTTQTTYSVLLGVLNEIKDRIQTGVNSGNFDIEDFIMPDDAFQTATDPGLACEPGYRRDSESVVCKPCPTGTFLNSTTGDCEYCRIGEYMNREGALLCDQCPDGYSTLATGSKDMHKCIKMCPPGFFSSSTLEPCSACPVGTFQRERGQAKCQLCPRGTATNSTNSTSHLDCQLFDIFVGQLTQRTSLGSFDFRGTSVISTSMWIKPLGSDDTGNVTLYFYNSDGDIITISASNFVEITIGTSLPVKTSLTLSSGHWTHITYIVDILAGNLEVCVDGLLVVDVAGNFNVSNVNFNELDVDIRSYSDGFYLSGLSVYPRKFTSQDMAALTELCSVTLGEAIITMSDILNNLVPGITLVMPTSCDPIDECQNRTCGEHICINKVDGFQCVCLSGMTGVLCDIPPDYCLNNQCVHGDCIPRNETYTCSCNDGFTGVFCDKPPVDGVWSDWSFWSECSVTCDGGTRSRTRLCNNPPPGYLGQVCQGNDQEHEQCSTSQCPECPTLKRKFGTIVTCVWNTQENRKECNMTCINGKLLPNGQKPFEKYWCGFSTNYTWVPTDKIPECVDAVRPDIFGIEMSVSYNTSVPRSDETTVQATVKDRLSIIPCVEQTSCNMTTYFSSNISRQRRESTTTLSLQLAVTLKDDGDLALEDYLATGTVSSAMGELLDSLQAMKTAIEFIQNDTASIFDVTVDGMNYAIDNNLTEIVAMVTCAEGMAGADGVCVKCAAGTREDKLLCIDCEPGTYQPLTGQIKCIPCPVGFTTASYGASSISDCSVELPNTHDDEQPGYVRDEVGLNLAMIIVVVVLSVAIFLILVTVVAVVTWKKFSRKNTQNKTRDSFASLNMTRLFTTENQYSTNLLQVGRKLRQ